MVFISMSSFLNSLIPCFNECADGFVQRLRLVANGVTNISMKDEFNHVTRTVISKVS